MNAIKYLLLIYLFLILLFSIISFVLFSMDKKRAIKDQIRIKEKNLLLCTILNGAIGSFLARIIMHHKTEKVYFSIVIYFALFCQIIILFLLIYYSFFVK